MDGRCPLGHWPLDWLFETSRAVNQDGPAANPLTVSERTCEPAPVTWPCPCCLPWDKSSLRALGPCGRATKKWAQDPLFLLDRRDFGRGIVGANSSDLHKGRGA